MTRLTILAACLACTLALAPGAMAGAPDTQATPTAPPSTSSSTTSDTATTSTAPDTATSGTTSTTTTTTPPPTTTTTTTTTDTPTTTTTTTNTPPVAVGTGTDLPDLPALPSNDPCVDSIAACDGPVAGEGVGPQPVYGAGRGLPYTGIEDALLPVLAGLLAFLGGIIAYRHATVRERLGRAMRVAQERAARRRVTGYTWALRNMDEDSRTAAFWTGGRPPRAA